MSSNEQPWILGISASHNGSVCLLKGDEIVVAVQEERLSRFKRHRLCGAGPSLALPYCLTYAGIEPRDLSLVVLCVQGQSEEKAHDIRLNSLLNVVSNRIPTITIPHHYGHALSVFATSGFKDAAVLVVDGAGSPSVDFLAEESKVITGKADGAWETVSLYAATDTSLVPLEKHVVEQGRWLTFYEKGMPAFGSLGGMFSAAAQQIFGDPMEAGKVMGLAPYGTPEIPTSAFFDITEGGFHFKDTASAKFAYDEPWPARQSEYANLASSVQTALEDALVYLVQRLRIQCASENLCYAGGVALNSVANERIVRESGFKAVHIMPAADDSGPAIGAAYHGLWKLTNTNSLKKLQHDACGRLYPAAAISSSIEKTEGLKVWRSPDLIADVADLLCDGKIVGWFDGGSELGPRALGQRSILCDPRRTDAKEVLNSRVKMREAFRPFAPVILLEEVENWFELSGAPPESPFMLRVCRFKSDRIAAVPAVVHVDQTGRLQTVTREVNGRFYELVRKFYEKTGIPIILNTSFNIMGEPIVETPTDALSCLLNTGLDCCVFEDRIVFKESVRRF
jgi:carbamoyltransferase